jgi:hypothetical protein
VWLSSRTPETRSTVTGRQQRGHDDPHDHLLDHVDREASIGFAADPRVQVDDQRDESDEKESAALTTY